MLLSIVILTYNQVALTRRCLESLYPITSNSDVEIIIVDNGSTDGTADMVRQQFQRVRYIAMPVNLGVAVGRNAGLTIARGDYLMLLDNDTIALPVTIFNMLEYIQADNTIGILAPRLVSPEGRVQRSFKSFPGVGVKLRNAFGRVSQDIQQMPMDLMEPFYVIGAAQMFPRMVYEQAGPLDEKIFYGPEDADFCMAVRAIGYRVVYNPDMSIVHDWQRATTRKILSPLARKHLKGLLHFYWKHKRLF